VTGLARPDVVVFLRLEERTSTYVTGKQGKEKEKGRVERIPRGVQVSVLLYQRKTVCVFGDVSTQGGRREEKKKKERGKRNGKQFFCLFFLAGPAVFCEEWGEGKGGRKKK